jgi:hypothetical protein
MCFLLQCFFYQSVAKYYLNWLTTISLLRDGGFLIIFPPPLNVLFLLLRLLILENFLLDALKFVNQCSQQYLLTRRKTIKISKLNILLNVLSFFWGEKICNSICTFEIELVYIVFSSLFTFLYVFFARTKKVLTLFSTLVNKIETKKLSVKSASPKKPSCIKLG